MDAVGAQGLCILLRHGQGLGGTLDGMHLGVRSLQRQGDGDDAAAGAQFQQGQRDGAPLLAQQRELLQRGFHQGFGVGPGNEHGGRDGKGAAVELLLAQQIGQGFAGAAAFGQGLEAGGDVRVGGIVTVGHEPGQRLAGEAGQQAACLGPGQLAVADEVVDGGGGIDSGLAWKQGGSHRVIRGSSLGAPAA